jgi:hypothetical protein
MGSTIAGVDVPRREPFPSDAMFWLPRGRILRVWASGVVVVAAWFPIVKAATQPHTTARLALLVVGLVGFVALIATVIAMGIRSSNSS